MIGNAVPTSVSEGWGHVTVPHRVLLSPPPQLLGITTVIFVLASDDTVMLLSLF